jgi:integrase
MTIRKREYKNRQNLQIWDYDFWFNNVRYRKAGFGSKAEAEIAETRAKQLVYSGKRTLRPSIFADIVEPFLEYRRGRVSPKTQNNDRNRINTMLSSLGEKKLALITVADIEKFISQRCKEGKAARTVNLAINLLSSIFQYAVAHGYAYENPVKQIKRLRTVQVEQAMPTNEQFLALVDAAHKTEVGLEFATWIIFRGYTGTRPTESYYMEWRDIDFNRNQVFIRPKEGNTLKNGKVRVLPLHPELKVALLKWKTDWDKAFDGKKKPHDWIFFNPRFPNRRCGRFEKSYPQAQKLANLPEHLTSHSLRHFFISQCVQSGINFLTIAQWVGHSSIKMIQEVYAHLSPDFKNSEMQKLQLGIGQGNASGATDNVAN